MTPLTSLGVISMLDTARVIISCISLTLSRNTTEISYMQMVYLLVGDHMGSFSCTKDACAAALLWKYSE